MANIPTTSQKFKDLLKTLKRIFRRTSHFSVFSSSKKKDTPAKTKETKKSKKADPKKSSPRKSIEGQKFKSAEFIESSGGDSSGSDDDRKKV
jgi:hypothetical protein